MPNFPKEMSESKLPSFGKPPLVMWASLTTVGIHTCICDARG